MEFYDIPENRCIRLDESKIKERGYQIPTEVLWVAQGANPYFNLVPPNDVPKSADIIFGPTNITKSCWVKIPLNAYSKYCV